MRTNEAPDTAKAGQQKIQAGFMSEAQVLKQVPVSRRTWWSWKQKKIVPFIRIGRRCLYHWPSVEAALLRAQRNAE